ncbi:MAG: hypothetical protein PUB11_01295 [Oscillospiraceae bacterium]|nr:hypothetical protein [Oscillospiraceae bacterium]
MVYVLAIVIVLVILIFFTFTPGGARRAQRELFYGYYYAENGVTDENDVPNSKEAFEKCAENGVGIKVSAYHSEDMKIFLAEKLSVDGTDITDINSDVLSEKGFMKLSELLSIVNGRVPIIVEIKPTKDNDKNCRLVADLILSYPFGNCAVASLHSGTIAWFKHTEKSIFRILISAPAADFIGLSKTDAFLNGNLLRLSASRPQMIVYRNKPLSFLVKFCYAFGASHGTFTITDSETAKSLEEEMDCMFIKGFMPRSGKYKDMPVIEMSKAEEEQIKKREEKERRRARKIEIEKIAEEEKRQKKIARGEKIVDKKAAYLYDEEEFGPLSASYDEDEEKPHADNIE